MRISLKCGTCGAAGEWDDRSKGATDGSIYRVQEMAAEWSALHRHVVVEPFGAWTRFLDARRALIVELRDEGRSWESIYGQIGLEQGQAQEIYKAWITRR